MSEYLFVYGSLSPALAPPEVAHIVQRFRSVGRATVIGQLYDFGKFRGAVLGATRDRVIHGEVFEIPAEPALIEALDRYEGIDPGNPEASPFARARTTARLADGQSRETWIYVYNQDPGAAPLVN